MFVLCSKISVGGKRFGGVHDVQIERSIYKIGATAAIKVPVTAVLRYAGHPPAEVETAKAIKVGDPVVIELGYDGTCHVEFRGYVKQLNLKTPLEILCEDEFYQTRLRNITLQGKTTLSEVLQKCGLDVGYSAALTLSQFPVDNRPASWVLGKLKTDYGLAIWFDLNGKVYASEPFKAVGDTVKYVLRENVISEDDLKYQRADDVKLKVTAICIYRDGTKVEAGIGAEDGTEKKLYFYDVKDRNELALLAQAQLKRYSYDGYTGKIGTFLFPYAAPAMLAEISDQVYSERDGRYYVEGVTVSYGRGGARRSVEIGLKV
jgi:hypothetical protein